MTDQADQRDPRATGRNTRAEQYFEQDLKGQRRWYSERASSYKRRTQLLRAALFLAQAQPPLSSRF